MSRAMFECRRRPYIGITFIHDKEIFSWTAPVAKLWYTQSYEDGYTAPKGYIATRVDLKRYLKIRTGRLEALNDIFRRQRPAPPTARKEVLEEALSGVSSDDGQLQVIIETIEPDQYEKIANVSDKVLIVQGAAGSGKSEIGLHRIAFLLSPFSGIPAHQRPTPRTTLFVGPSQAFLEYAADILPTLDVQENVEQVKFSDWLISRLSVRTPIYPKIWNNLLDRGEMTRFNEQAETFKGSLAMADVIERHLAKLAEEVRRRCLRLPTEIPGPSSTGRVSHDQVRSLVNGVLPVSALGQQLNRRRVDFINRVVRLVQPTGPNLRQLTSEERDRRRSGIHDAVTRWCDSVWKRRDFREDYVALLSDSERLIRLAAEDTTYDAAAQLAKSAARIRDQGFADSDLGPLAYLDHLLNGTIESRYRHIVVDEAQDISPN